MEELNSSIRDLEVLISFFEELSDEGMETNEIDQFFRPRTISVSEMEIKLEAIKEEKEQLGNVFGQLRNDELLKIQKKIVDLEQDVRNYINNGGLERVIKKELDEIVAEAEEISNSKEDVNKKSEKLEFLKIRYEKILAYMKDSKIFFDVQKNEKCIARAILSVMNDKHKNGIQVNTQIEIPKRYTHVIIYKH